LRQFVGGVQGSLRVIRSVYCDHDSLEHLGIPFSLWLA
jgi:hypothetical protein